MSGDPQRLTFGLVPPDSFLGVEPRVNAFLRWIGDHAGVWLVRRQARSYDDLVELLRGGALDVAWLPPIPFARLASESVVNAMVTAERGGHDAYVSVLMAHAEGDVHALADVSGRRVGWVDPLSATGYVIPRMRLASRFGQHGPAFLSESFFGSHAGVARAIVDRQIDVGATYGGLGEGGELVRGPFLDLGVDPALFRVVESFGAIPPDVVAVHTSVGADTAARLATAFEEACRDPAILAHVNVVFGAMAFGRKALAGYDRLREEVELGVDSGLIPASAAFLSTRPPPGT